MFKYGEFDNYIMSVLADLPGLMRDGNGTRYVVDRADYQKVALKDNLYQIILPVNISYQIAVRLELDSADLKIKILKKKSMEGIYSNEEPLVSETVNWAALEAFTKIR